MEAVLITGCESAIPFPPFNWSPPMTKEQVAIDNGGGGNWGTGGGGGEGVQEEKYMHQKQFLLLNKQEFWILKKL